MKYINNFETLTDSNTEVRRTPQLAAIDNQIVYSKRIPAQRPIAFQENISDNIIEVVEVACITLKNGHTVACIGEDVDGERTITSNFVRSISPNCDNIKKVEISSPITKIGNDAFTSQSNLETAIIGDNVSEIGDSAFWGCNDLKNVTLPSTLTEIGNSVFDGCSDLTSIIIPDSVTRIGNNAFRYTNLENVNLPSRLKTIGEQAFYGTPYLTNIDIPGSVLSIGNSAFQLASSLEAITLNEGLLSIGERAFMTHGSFPGTITIPSTVTSIGDGAFGTSNWQTQWPPVAYFGGTKQQWISRFGTEGLIFSWKEYYAPGYIQVTLCTIPIHCANDEIVEYTSIGWEPPQDEGTGSIC